ncbi:MAG: T9SS type A sorting domain-containing protein [Bacteroidales bacterium]|nr:T9SS type A sorting domain-containing protein [Bacteroidales bacterium]
MKKSTISLLFILIGIAGLAQWGPVNNGIGNLTSGAKLLGSSATHLFSGTLAGPKMYRSNDNGNNWSEIQPPVTGNLPECGYYFNGKYFSGLSSSMDCIFTTADNGTTWNTVSGGPATTWVRGFIHLQDILFAYTSSMGVYRSTDGGSTWSTANNGIGNLNIIFMETINTKLFAATIGGGLFVSDDHGSSWTSSNNGIAGGDLNAELVWRMGSNLYYTAQGGGSYVSSNEGANWTAWAKPAIMGLGVLEFCRKGTHLYFESRHFAGGLRDSLYMSSDEGSSWTNITGNLLATDLNASGITEFNGYPFIAYNLMTPGNGIYRRDGPTGIPTVVNNNNIELYPNPFSDRILLLNKSKEEVTGIQIYDASGRTALSCDGVITSIVTSSLKPGIYLIKLKLANGTMVYRKMIK